MKNSFLLVIIVLVSACEMGKKSEPIRTGTYFDLVELLDEQVAIIDQQKPKLIKELTVDGQTETVTTTLDSASMWKEELQLFYQADINKLGLEDAYITEQLSAGTDRYKKIDSAKTNAPTIRTIEYNYYKNVLENIRIVVREKNTVYEFDKELLLEFKQINGKSLLSSFAIKGNQKMVLKSPLTYSLNAKLEWPL